MPADMRAQAQCARLEQLRQEEERKREEQKQLSQREQKAVLREQVEVSVTACDCATTFSD